MGCATGLVKAVMFVFNFIFVAAGLGMIVLGVMFLINMNNMGQAIDPIFMIAPTIILIAGAIIFIIAFFGCCGVIRESHCMLVTYAVLLLTIFAIQLALGIYAYLQVDKADGDVQPLIKKTMNNAFDKYKHNKEVQEAFDFMQKEFECCGVNGPTDYDAVSISELLSQQVPASCCVQYDGKPCSLVVSQTLGVFGKSTVYTDGCLFKITDMITKNTQNLSYAAIGISATEIIGAIFAFCLASSIKNESRRRYP